jgi:hypothetical protein
MSEVEAALESIEKGDVKSFYLVTGDRVIAEPGGVRLAEALARSFGCEVDVVKRPESLGPVLHDLRTMALFAPGKVSLVVESSLLADEGTSAALLDEAIDILPLSSADADLGERERRAAACLLKAIRSFGLDPYAGTSEAALEQLPRSVFEGGPAYRKKSRRRRNARQIESARAGLSVLLEAARRAEMQGIGESDEEVLIEIARDGLSPGHALVLAESAWSPSHPLVAAARESGALVSLGQVSPGRRGAGWSGLDVVCEELKRETGVGIDGRALAELARRTLRKRPGRGSRGDAIDSESTARFAAEYRKLATFSAGSDIELELVREITQDRGEEDVWGILDAVGEGRAKVAIAGIDRLLKGSEDVIAMRLSVFSLLASFCRQLTTVAGMVRATGVPASEKNYRRFKDQIAPQLQRSLDGERDNPLSGVHPFRLHRAYLAASRLGAESLRRLPARVLETERRLKGDSASPDAALIALVADVATARDARR